MKPLDIEKDLTILVTGRGKSRLANVIENLDDWVFAGQEREVHIILPVLSDMGPGMKIFFQWLDGLEGIKFSVVQAGNSGMIKEISALPEESFMREADDRAAMAKAMEILAGDHGCGNATAVLMMFDPKSTYTQGESTISDQEMIIDFKDQEWLTTLNLCEGLVDSFEGYESAADRVKREAAEAEFAEKAKAAEAAKPAPAKKVAAPRKTAAKKAVAPKPKETPVEPEKAAESPSKTLHVHRYTFVADKGEICECGSINDHIVLPEPSAIKTGWGDHVHHFTWADDENGHEGSVCMSCGEAEPEPYVAPHDRLVARAVAREAEQKAKRDDIQEKAEALNLSASVKISPKPKSNSVDSHSWDLWDGGMGWTAGRCRNCGISYPSGGEPVPSCGSGTFTGESSGTYGMANVVLDIQKDISDHHFTMTVEKTRKDAELLAQLGENIQAMGKAFTDTIGTLMEMIKEKNG